MPGNVFVHAFVSIEPIREFDLFSTAGYWSTYTAGVRYSHSSVWPIPGAPEPPLFDHELEFGPGDVMEGWLSLELPAESTSYLHGVDVNRQRTEEGWDTGVMITIPPE